MMDTGATVSLVTKRWCATHKVDYASIKNHPVVQATNGQPLHMVGTASLTIRLSLSLEIDLKGVTVHDVPGSCVALIGMDLLNGQKRVLGPASVTLAAQAVQAVVKFTLNSFSNPFWRWSQLSQYQLPRSLLATSRAMASIGGFPGQGRP